jgi:acyl-CoA reductase-like NAD-dependent aldehyde dehydrogenase
MSPDLAMTGVTFSDPTLFRQACYIEGAWMPVAQGATIAVDNPAIGGTGERQLAYGGIGRQLATDLCGRPEIGKLLMSQCAGTVKKVSLELGGNAPFIVPRSQVPVPRRDVTDDVPRLCRLGIGQ